MVFINGIGKYVGKNGTFVDVAIGYTLFVVIWIYLFELEINYVISNRVSRFKCVISQAVLISKAIIITIILRLCFQGVNLLICRLGDNPLTPCFHVITVMACDFYIPILTVILSVTACGVYLYDIKRPSDTNKLNVMVLDVVVGMCVVTFACLRNPKKCIQNENRNEQS